MTIYNRHNPANNYDRHLFRGDKVLQSSELNEIQSNLFDRIGNIGSVLFKNGDIIRDASCVVDAVTGAVNMASGSLYLSGAVRGIGPGNFTIAITGSVVIGVYLQEVVVDELADPALLNPAVGTRGYMEPGAARLQINPVWGYAGDEQPGQFYPVYEVLDGVLKAKEAPPSIDAVNAAIQRYDRASTGGSYIVAGMDVRRGTDLSGDTQTYIIAAGQARANGRQVTLNAAVRHIFDASPDLKTIEAEPHVSTGVGAQRIDVDYTPMAELQEVTITADKTDALVHGAIVGSMDPLPETSVLQIIAVTQGATTYVKNTDYKLTAGKVDWSLAGAEPAPGSTYNAHYQHIKVATPTGIDATGFSVAGAVADTLVLATYRYKVPRVDRLAINESSDVVIIRGVASDWMPVPPSVPVDLLLLATVYQQWDDSISITQDSPRMVPMGDLAHLQTQLDALRLMIATQQLRSDAAGRETTLKKSILADPLLDDSMRDAGVLQTGAIVGGALTLPITQRAHYYGSDIAGIATLAHSVVPLIEQLRRTGTMPVNPYQSFAPVAAQIILDPAIDQMTYSTDTWTSSLTSRMVRRVAWGDSAGVGSSETLETVSSARTADQLCRPQTIAFTIHGFGAGETVAAASFDGIAVSPGTLADLAVLPVADVNGVATGRFNIPLNVPAGRKTVQFIGSGGSFGSAYYTAASWTEDRVLRRVVTEYVYEYDPPPPPDDPPYVPEIIVDDPEPQAIAPPPLDPPDPDSKRSTIEQMYVTYLGRVGDEEGINYWVAELNEGKSLGLVMTSFITAGVEGQAPNITPEGRQLWEVVKSGRCVNSTDPLAQTFVTPAAAHLMGIDLWFDDVGATDVVVQLRTVSTGLPTRTTLAESRLTPAAIHTDGTATRALFTVPYYANAGEELAFVVMCNDADTALSIAELGKWDGNAWVTAQPYTIGVLLSSSNNSTWTAHQDRDIRFRVLAASYTESVRNIDLGTITVTDATDLMVLGLEEKPGANSAVVYTVTLPDSTTINAASNQPLTLTAPVTGLVHLHAQLRGNEVAGPVLHRGGQLLVGWLGTAGDYVSRAMRAGIDSRVRVVVDVLLPSGSTLVVKLKGGDVGDTWSAALPQIASTALDNGFHELVFEVSDVDENLVQVRLAASGDAAARPFVRNLRVMVM